MDNSFLDAVDISGDDESIIIIIIFYRFICIGS